MRDLRSPLDGFLSPFGAVRGRVFSPLSLFASSEAGAWYDPSDLSTLWKDTAGTDPVTTDTDIVARMDDKSGNGNNLTQDTLAARPRYRTAGGLHWLEFDGGDDRLLSATFTNTFTEAFISAGLQYNDATLDITFGAEKGSADRFYLYSTGGKHSLAVVQSTPTSSGDFLSGTTNGTTKAVVSGRNTSALYIDGVSEDTGGAFVPAFVDGVYFIGRSLTFSLNAFAGDFYGGLIIDRAISVEEQASVEAYLAAKSGVVI